MNRLQCKGNYSATSNNVVDGWAVTFGTVYSSTASVPITVLLHDGPLLCGFNVPIERFTLQVTKSDRCVKCMLYIRRRMW